MKLLTTICTAWFLVAGTTTLSAQSSAPAEKMLESARHKEVMEGDLKGAVEQYRKIAAQFAKQPEIAARALYQLGQCQEKLGQAEARKSYERIVREYGGAQQYAAAARARLGALGGLAVGPVQARLLWDNPIGSWGTASADGRHLSFVHWPTLGVGIRDNTTGDIQVVPNTTLFGRGKGESGGTVISPDAKRVAFGYYRHNRPASESGYDQLHVFNADGSGHKVLLAGQDIDYVEPYSWSPDARWIAAAVVNRGQTQFRLALVPSSGGEPRYLSIPTKQLIRLARFSPDGKWLAYTASTVRGADTAVYLCSTIAGAETEVKLADNAYPMGWTPDSSGVLFSRERSGKQELNLQLVAAGKPSGEPKAIHTSSDIGTHSLGVSSQGTLFYSISNRHTDATLYPFDGDLSKLGNPALKLPVTGNVSWLLGGGTMRFSPDGKRLLAIGISSRDLIIRSLGSDSHQTIT
ncbi:MAG: hypothetical protein B7Z50_01985, partial [Sphingomonadales bacterium 12-62-5]